MSCIHGINLLHIVRHFFDNYQNLLLPDGSSVISCITSCSRMSFFFLSCSCRSCWPTTGGLHSIGSRTSIVGAVRFSRHIIKLWRLLSGWCCWLTNNVMKRDYRWPWMCAVFIGVFFNVLFSRQYTFSSFPTVHHCRAGADLVHDGIWLPFDVGRTTSKKIIISIDVLSLYHLSWWRRFMNDKRIICKIWPVI